jgi:hypothetical protein
MIGERDSLSVSSAEAGTSAFSMITAEGLRGRAATAAAGPRTNGCSGFAGRNVWADTTRILFQQYVNSSGPWTRADAGYYYARQPL